MKKKIHRLTYHNKIKRPLTAAGYNPVRSQRQKLDRGAAIIIFWEFEKEESLYEMWSPKGI